LKLLTLCIIAVAVTVGGLGAIGYYAYTNPTYTVTTQILSGSGRVMVVPEVGLGYIQDHSLTLQVGGGDSLKLTVVPDPGWRFSSWGGDLVGNVAPVTVRVDKNLYITAILVPG
jgi:hypothetical protein